MPNKTRRTKPRGEAEKILALNRKDELNVNIEYGTPFPSETATPAERNAQKTRRTKQPEEKPKNTRS